MLISDQLDQIKIRYEYLMSIYKFDTFQPGIEEGLVTHSTFAGL